MIAKDSEMVGNDLKGDVVRPLRLKYPDLTRVSQEIDNLRPMKVIVIGAGISGILAAIRFSQRIQNLDLTIYDKNPEVGGTWYENRYPGVACGMCLFSCCIVLI